MNKYNQGKVYQIRRYSNSIGSTTVPLFRRLAKHKSNYKFYLKGEKGYAPVFDLVRYDDCYIEVLENYRCNNKEELNSREHFHIRENECVNKLIKQVKKENKPGTVLKVDCICGSSILKADLKKHERSKKHQLFINSITPSSNETEIISDARNRDSNNSAN